MENNIAQRITKLEVQLEKLQNQMHILITGQTKLQHDHIMYGPGSNNYGRDKYLWENN